MKNNPIIKKRIFIPFFILWVVMTISCINIKPKSDENSTDENETTGHSKIKKIEEVILVDNGAVVPSPLTRRVTWRLKNDENILLHYTEQNGDDSKLMQSDMTLTGDARDEMRDEIEKVAEFTDDALSIKQGKQPCVGMNSLQVSVIYSTGDTSRIAISGSVRCDPSLYPSVWALDSMATEMYKKNKTQ